MILGSYVAPLFIGIYIKTRNCAVKQDMTLGPAHIAIPWLGIQTKTLPVVPQYCQCVMQMHVCVLIVLHSQKRKHSDCTCVHT